MVHTTCAVLDCISSSRRHKELSYHSFPRDKERLEFWIEACKRPELLNRNLEHIYVCSKHFLKCMYGSKNLKKNAVPTLFLPTAPAETTSSLGIIEGDNDEHLGTVKHLKLEEHSEPEEQLGTEEHLEPEMKRRKSSKNQNVIILAHCNSDDDDSSITSNRTPVPKKGPPEIKAFSYAIAEQLYVVDEHQRFIAEKLISNIIYNARIRKLKPESFISI
ncbi:unnamed protein product [Leptidea sinapis]|uniref:THAP-type domain-containing protein n=1 Tax=Leptidea sinapis TaxID=189913 RepID=A0A5E4QWY0_9NEOP|nr:unnamed protein product [Leptidea sinapis]